MNNPFAVAVAELLRCVACMDPRESFSKSNKNCLLKPAKYCPTEFSNIRISVLDNQLETYSVDMCMDNRFSNLKCIGDLFQKTVELKKVKKISISVFTFAIRIDFSRM